MNAVCTTQQVPALNPHFRFQWEPAQKGYVLLYPEGMVKLNGPAGEILACVDGTRDVAAIIGALQKKFPEADSIDQDIMEFLGEAHEQHWISFN